MSDERSRIKVVATRDIKFGEGLSVWYGEDYFRTSKLATRPVGGRLRNLAPMETSHMMELDDDGDREADNDDAEYTFEEKSDNDFDDDDAAEDDSEEEHTPCPTPRRSRRR